MSEPNGGFVGSDSGSVGTTSPTDGSAGSPSGGTGGSDFASAGTGGQATTNGTSGGEGYNGKINPAWNPVLEHIPAQLHPLVTPHLRKWDDNYRNLQQQYSPWKQNFADKGMTAEQMQNAALIYQQINNGPEEFYRRLGNALGVSPQQAEQMVEEELEGDEADDTSEISPAIQQQFEALRQQNLQLMQMQQSQQHEAQVNHYQQQIDTEIQQIKRANPNVDVNDLMNRYLVQINRAEQDRSVKPSLQSAYQEQQVFIQNQVAAMGLRVPAPNVISPGGGMPPTGQTTKPVTQDDRVKVVQNMIAMRQRQQ